MCFVVTIYILTLLFLHCLLFFLGGGVIYYYRITDLLEKTLLEKSWKNRMIVDNFSRYSKLKRLTSWQESITTASDQVPQNSPRNPESNFRRVWDAMILLIILYNTAAIPARLALNTSPLSFITDYILDIVLVLDIYLNDRVFGFMHEGKLFTKEDEIRARYRSTWRFYFDIIAAIPWDLIGLAFLKHKHIRLVMAFLRIPKYFRTHQLIHYANRLEHAFEEWQFFITPSTIKLTRLLIGIMLVTHTAACLFYIMAVYAMGWRDCLEFDPLSGLIVNERGMNAYAECKWSKTWIQGQIESNLLPPSGGTIGHRYLRALYWAIPTLVAVVIGDVVPINNFETLFCILAILVGVLINASVIGNIADVISNLGTDQAAFRQRSADLEHFMNMRDLSDDLRNRVRDFMEYKWMVHKGCDESSIVNDLPFTLRLEVSNLLKLRLIRTCPVFYFCDTAIHKSLAYSLIQQFYGPGDVIVQEGDLGHEMFFIVKGVAEVVSSDSVLYSIIAEGSSFGEPALFFSEQRRVATVRAADFCEVYALRREDADAVLSKYPYEKGRMMEEVNDLCLSHIRRNRGVEINASLFQTNKKIRQYMGEIHNTSLSQSRRHLVSESDASKLNKLWELFHPNSSFRVFWNLINLVSTIYLAVTVPLRLSFFTDPTDNPIWIWIGLEFVIVDLFFLADLYMRSRYFIVMEEGRLVTDSSEIFSVYVRSWLPFDAISSLPIDAIALLINPDIGIVTHSFLRVPRLVRLLRLSHYLESLDRFFYHKRIKVSFAAMQVFRAFLMLLLINHWYGCMWFFIHRYLERNEPITWAIVDGLASFDQVTGEHNICETSLIECYIRAVYFTVVTLTSVGYGDIRPYTKLETVYQLLVVLTGATTMAAIIGTIVFYFTYTDNIGRNGFKTKINELKEYMKYRDLPEKLQDSILLHYRALWERQQGLDESVVMQDLPIPLRVDIAMHINRALISKV